MLSVLTSVGMVISGGQVYCQEGLDVWHTISINTLNLPLHGTCE